MLFSGDGIQSFKFGVFPADGGGWIHLNDDFLEHILRPQTIADVNHSCKWWTLFMYKYAYICKAAGGLNLKFYSHISCAG